MDWKQTIIEWRKLSAQERRQRHLRAIPRGVTTSMAMERQPVSEQFVRERLQRRLQWPAAPALHTNCGEESSSNLSRHPDEPGFGGDDHALPQSCGTQ